MPEKKIAVFGLKPINIGPKTVAPNIASTCCRPTRMVCPHGSRSSGAMMPSFFGVQLVKYPCFSAVAMQFVLLRKILDCCLLIISFHTSNMLGGMERNEHLIL